MGVVVGMSRSTGQTLSPLEHLRQSILKILTTPKGSRRMRPLFGSNLGRMVDLPVTAGWKSAVQAEIATALASRTDALGHEYGEPRLQLQSVQVYGISQGQVLMRLRGIYQGEPVSLELAA